MRSLAAVRSRLSPEQSRVTAVSCLGERAGTVGGQSGAWRAGTGGEGVGSVAFPFVMFCSPGAGAVGGGGWVVGESGGVSVGGGGGGWGGGWGGGGGVGGGGGGVGWGG